MHLKCHSSLTDQLREFLCKHKIHLPHTQLFELHWPTQKTDNCEGKKTSTLLQYGTFFLSSFNSMVNNFFFFNFFLIRARRLKPQLLFLRRGRQVAEVQKPSTRILLAGQEWSLTFVGKDASMWSAYTTMLPVHCSFTTLLCPCFFFLTEHHECL